MITIAALGAGFGLSMLIGWRALVPATPPLAVSLQRFDHGRQHRDPLVDASAWRAILGQRGHAFLTAVGIDPGSSIRADLDLLDRPLEHHVAEKALGVLTGALLPWVWAGLAVVAGIVSPPSVPAVMSLAAATGGYFLPDLVLRRDALRARRDCRVALGCWLDLVVVNLAGGAGVESAMADAAAIGDGPMFEAIRQALLHARLNGDSPWEALAQLGRRIALDELVELSATISLAGTEGSRVRASLVAKAAAMRDREVAEAEARAQSATERMAVPTVMLMAGFIVLVGYPAVRAVMTGL